MIVTHHVLKSKIPPKLFVVIKCLVVHWVMDVTKFLIQFACMFYRVLTLLILFRGIFEVDMNDESQSPPKVGAFIH